MPGVSNPLSTHVYDLVKDSKFYISRGVYEQTQKEELEYTLHVSVGSKEVRDEILNILSSYKVLQLDDPTEDEEEPSWSLTIIQDHTDLMYLDLMSLSHLDGKTEFLDIAIEYMAK